MSLTAILVSIAPVFLIIVLGYLLQGLFHPARKVREIYWKIYNTLYIGAQDALVSQYPALEDEGENQYRRHELDVFL